MNSPDNSPLWHNQHNRYVKANSVDDFKHNLMKIQQRINNACLRVDREPSDVRLLPVSKTFHVDDLRLAYAAGCRTLGENKVQEAHKKSEMLADLAGLKWAVIGHLQTNKAKYVARFASEFHALDNLRVAQELDRRLQIEGRSLDVFVQVNTSGEPSKYGLTPHDTADFIKQLPQFSALNVKGLMTLAIFSAQQQRVRECFKLLRTLQHQLQQIAPNGIDLSQLSMGMSGDFEIAIEEGATIVRVGQAIFGARTTPDYLYWPSQN